MNLLRYYFEIGGEHFDVNAFSDTALKNGLPSGRIRTINNIKLLTNNLTKTLSIRKIFSGIVGTDCEKYVVWSTPIVNYVTDRELYLANLDLGMTTEAAQVWLKEEIVLLEFLDALKNQLPNIEKYCSSSFFSCLKLIYGYDETDSPGGGHHYSQSLLKKLSDLSADLSSDSESFELHFLRIKSDQA